MQPKVNLQSFKSTPDSLKQRLKAFGRKRWLGVPEKRQELKFKLKEASAKRYELEETSAKIRDAASALGNTGQRYVSLIVMKEITQFAPAEWQNVSQCFSVDS